MKLYCNLFGNFGRETCKEPNRLGDTVSSLRFLFVMFRGSNAYYSYSQKFINYDLWGGNLIWAELQSSPPLTTVSILQWCHIVFGCTLRRANENEVETKKKLHRLIPRANYTDRATAACRRSNFQLLRIRVPRGQRDGSRTTTFFFLVVPGIEPGPPDL
jgi:hypothetical protein